MKYRLSFFTTIVYSIAFCFAAAAQHASFRQDKLLLQTIGKNFKDADAQYKVLMKDLPPDRFPKTYDPRTNKLETSNSGWWCSGFYPGTLLYLYRQTKDEVLKTEANRMLASLEKEQYNKNTHDLGFMMYCSFGNAEKIEPQPKYKETLINSAKSLSTRFSPKVGCIKSWDSKPSDYIVIIDNMMNLELLFWATKATGDSSFYKIAVAHANTTMKNHFRPDYSSYHVINYNPETGAVQQKRTAQGAADESAWARGQAWGLYGFTVMYRETKDKKYLDQARHIASFILQNPNLPKDKIPYWDFNAPNIPNALRDASAAAVMASALLELCRYSNQKDNQLYFNSAQTILQTLSSPAYKAKPGTNGGFILEHSVGNFPGKSEVDVPLTYADYYFVEAMLRYQNINRQY
ncbi:MAG: glycoside hydrolase family 88 protein [Mucilaginibacter sp.]|uniref:glycoside hydrolase family 88 protein n=1 Tax=Mucilaginibacter sp. TaxID=1882438 RepID=UPI0034E3B1FB